MKARATYQKIEILLATLIAGFFIFIVVTDTDYSFGRHQFAENGIQYDFNRNYLQPFIGLIVVSWLVFLFLTQYVENKTKGFLKVMLIICSYLALAVTLSVCLTYIEAWRYGSGVYQSKRDVLASFFIEGFAGSLLAFAFYLIYYGLKELIFSPLLRKRPKITERGVIGTLSVLAWLFILIMLSANNAANFAVILWAVVLPYAFLMIYLNVFVLIRGLPVKKPFTNYYLSRIIPITLLINFVATVFCSAMVGRFPFIAIYMQLLVWTIVVVIPLSWWLYKNQKEKLGLKTALGSSEANLSFLRSQINPHFLFNALNTLYGTALQENADRTGEGIQKLGDMMRFMLHENVQDKILLAREVEYLKNYIDLQLLRTANSPGIQIKIDIEEPTSALQIAPMLLIPFVENAFKHGISLKEPSFISVALHTQNNTLFFDVQNTINLKPDGDPEKTKSGIGLQNVKERLQLEYPQKHELVIRQTAKEFFVHLTINL